MTYQIADFQVEMVIAAKIHNTNSNLVTELNALATALSTDTTTHDWTLEAPPAALAQNSTNSRFLNDALLTVNKGKGGNLTASAMSNAITNGLSQIFPPANTAAPAVTGTGTVGQTLSRTQGTWTYVPTSYAYSWLRDGVAIGGGASGTTYVLVAADSTHSVSCRVTATNAAGSTSIVSNAIAVT